MTTPRRIKDRTGEIVATINAIRDRLPTALHALTAQHANLDGYRTSASGADNGPGTGATTSITEATAIARIEGNHGRPGPTELATRLDSTLIEAHGTLKHALGIIDKLCPTVKADEVRCVGDGTEEGAGCTNVAAVDRKGMCVACYKRSWRRQRAS